MSSDERIHLLDELQSLLERQIELARQGNPAGEQIEILSWQAGSLVEEISRTGILELAEFENRRERLRDLYRKLSIILMTEKSKTGEQLSKTRKFKKMFAMYQNSV